MQKLAIASLLIWLALAVAPPWGPATVSVTVIQTSTPANHPFGGSIQLNDVTVPGFPALVQSWPLVNGSASAAGVTLSLTRLYEVDLLNDSHTHGCPCKRFSRLIFPALLPFTTSTTATVTLDAVVPASGIQLADDLQLHWSRIH
jgi:hypothetical protein